MSRYTLRLKDVCEYLYNNKTNDKLIDTDIPDIKNIFDVPDIDTIIKDVRTKIFDFSYPLPNNSEETKIGLETKIIKHYYMREIGFDSWGRFKLALNERLNLIIPYFNELYKSVEMNNDNPLSNNDYKETKVTNFNRNNSGNSTTTDNGSNKRVFEDTPTSQLGNTDYATNITTDTMNTTSNFENEGKSNGNEEMNRIITGLSGYSKQEMIARYRQNIINVDEAIINELYDLFLLIYN